MTIHIANFSTIDYARAWKLQQETFNKNIENKTAGLETQNTLMLLEHPHVYTLGKSGEKENLLISDEFLKEIGATFYSIDRGGDITYHGPGQLVGYPIFDLDTFKMGVRAYVHTLEEIMIEFCSLYNIKAGRLEGAAGVWLDADNARARKICAIGVKASRSVTMHGFALNVNTDLKYFDFINPCGFTDKRSTSLEAELGRKIEIEEVKNQISTLFAKFFRAEIVTSQNYELQNYK